MELERLCELHQILRIAEEMNVAGLKMHHVPCTVAADVCAKLGIDHRYVDLEEEEQHALGIGRYAVTHAVIRPGSDIKGRRFHRGFSSLENGLRERAWVGRILYAGLEPTLFLCGSEHVTSVARLWKSLGLPVTVVASLPNE